MCCFEPARGETAVRSHNMGRIFEIGDSAGLFRGLWTRYCKTIQKDSQKPADEYSRYEPDKVAAEYEKLFEEIKREIK